MSRWHLLGCAFSLPEVGPVVRSVRKQFAGRGAQVDRRLRSLEVLELVGLADKRNARVLSLSGGQQRRLDVAVALAGDPDLLFLDEPTTGFDPNARHDAWDIVKNLAGLGKTVLLTTHYMDEAQQPADEVALIARGRIVGGAPRPHSAAETGFDPS